MKVVAAVSADDARTLVELLASRQIPSQMEQTTEESGLEVMGVLVDEAHYDQACDAVEEWIATQPAETERRAKPRCPACGAAELEHADEIDYLNTMTKMTAIYHCPQCGYVFATA